MSDNTNCKPVCRTFMGGMVSKAGESWHFLVSGAISGRIPEIKMRCIVNFWQRAFLFVFLIIASVTSCYVYAQGMGDGMGMMGRGGVMDAMSQNQAFFDGKTLPIDLATPRPPESVASIAAGSKIFKERCAVCHGEKGDGKGEKAKDLVVKPWDFTFGWFKWRSTGSGEAPTDEDIFKTVSRGLHGTAMLPRSDLTTGQKWQVVYYLKTLSDFFEDEEKPKVVAVPSPTKSVEEYVAMGSKAYKKAKCYECHGHEGYGDGEKMDKLKDDWRRPILPTNFREQILKRGLNIEEIYLSIATGLNGTPMLSYSHILNDDEILAVSYYIRSISKKPSRWGMLGRMMNMTRDERTGMMIIMDGR